MYTYTCIHTREKEEGKVREKAVGQCEACINEKGL